MAIFFNEGEIKTRPGVYQRYSNVGYSDLVGAKDGICAIPVQANWGPIGSVVKNVNVGDLTRNYGSGVYGTGYTVPAAVAMFEGGANTVYTYRMGNGGKQASLSLEGLTVTAKYPGTLSVSVAIQAKLGDAAKKQLLVYVGNALVETWVFSADGANEGANLIAAVKDSKYIIVSGEAAVVAPVAVASGALAGGANPTVTNEDYSKAFAAFEPYYYNTIAIDVDDDEDMTLSLMLQAYLEDAHKLGKLGVVVVGQKTTVALETRMKNAAMFDDEKVVFLGGGWMNAANSKDGVLAICHTAGVIASCPSNKGITHAVINGATDLCESLKHSDYEAAIAVGMLMVSRSADGSIWYDSAINTLTTLEEGIQDAGWKKIRRVKTRFEAFYRLDTVLAPKAGRVSNDTDGIADIVQAGQRIIDAMVNEGKLYAGATFAEDPANPATGDSAWFIISMDDIDSLEKIYLHYQLRYSQIS